MCIVLVHYKPYIITFDIFFKTEVKGAMPVAVHCSTTRTELRSLFAKSDQQVFVYILKGDIMLG